MSYNHNVRKGGVTLESPKILSEASTQLAFVGKLGLKGCFAELEARPSEDRQAKGANAIP